MSNINYNFNKLTPFRFFCLTNFPFIEEDFDSLTTYELLCKIVEYLNKVINTTNSIGTQTEELTNAFNELKSYVDNYFTNLDVQQEINNKLNEMAQDGTLENIINEKIFSNLNNQVKNNTNDINNLSQNISANGTILIGDSYSLDRRPDVDITGWAIPLKNLMGLDDTNCFISQDNGGGFTVNGSFGTFENAISRLVIEDKTKIKNIIVAGGLNDIKAESKGAIKTAIQSFMNYCKTNFPNAKVYIGMIGWNIDDLYTSDNQFIRYRVINKVLPAYQEASQYGAIYLNGVENVMHDYNEYYDGAHPNQKMCNRLAYYIYQAFKNGYASVTYEDNGITFNENNIELNDFTLTEKVVNNQTIIFDNKENGSKILFNSNYPVVNNYSFYIGKINSKYMSCTYLNNQIVTCPAIITDTNNGKYQAVVSLYIKNFNFLHCHIVSGEIKDGLSIKEINLLNPYCSKPTIMQ